MNNSIRRRKLWLGFVLLALTASAARANDPDPSRQRLLYVASPGVRDYLQWGGHGVLVFDIDNGHRFVKRISLDGYGIDDKGKVLNIKGICANAGKGRLYVSTLKQLICVDLLTDDVLWQKSFDLGCDRMSISPDGNVIYLPSLEKDAWYVVDAATGEDIKRLLPKSRSHNTVYGIDGKHVYMAGLGSPLLSVATTDDHSVARTVGPFGNFIRPFTVNGAQTLVFVNVNDLLGFEIGDLTTNQAIHRVEVKGFPHGPPKRHGCPSHGIALTPDEREIWLCDAFNSRLHIFDATVMPPQQGDSITLREQPGWVTFTLDGTFAYPSTGEVIDAKSRRIVATLTDEEGRPVHSEKMLEIDFANGKPIENGDQFGLGRVRPVGQTSHESSVEH
jgi:DNA-binding beta-propeller fold protein YncE